MAIIYFNCTEHLRVVQSNRRIAVGVWTILWEPQLSCFLSLINLLTVTGADLFRFGNWFSLQMFEEKRRTVYNGNESAVVLEKMLAIMLRDRGYISNWANVALLGVLIIAYSNLGEKLLAMWFWDVPNATALQWRRTWFRTIL